MAQVYDHSLMESIAIQSTPFSLIVLYSHSEPSIKALKRLIQTDPIRQIANLVQGELSAEL